MKKVILGFVAFVIIILGSCTKQQNGAEHNLSTTHNAQTNSQTSNPYTFSEGSFNYTLDDLYEMEGSRT